MLISYFLPGDGSTLLDCQANSIDHDSIFALSFLKRRRSTFLPSKIINADNGNPGLFVN